MVLSEHKRLLNLQRPLECFFFTTYTICKFVSERCDNIFFHPSHKYYWLLRERRESHLLLSFQRLPLLNAWEDVFVNFFCKYLHIYMLYVGIYCNTVLLPLFFGYILIFHLMHYGCYLHILFIYISSIFQQIKNTEYCFIECKICGSKM